MEKIRIFIEKLIDACGITGDWVHIASHVLMVLAAFLLAALTGWTCKHLLVPLILKATARTKTKWDDILLNERVLTSACHIVPAVVVWVLLPLVFYQFPTVQTALARLTAIYITITFAHTLVVFIDSFKLFESDKRSAAQQYLYTFCSLLKILLLFITAIIVIAILVNKNPLTLLAGLGATSAILMLVFQDTITGLVAGVRLTSNDMLHKGDWITVEKAGVNGIVEEMTLTTVKVRNFDNTIVTISPKTLVNDSFQNWIGMQQSGGRKVVKRVYFDFRYVGIIDDAIRDTLTTKGYFRLEDIPSHAVNITLLREYVERWLRTNDDVNADMTILVRQAEATPTGLAVEFVFFLKAKSGVPYEHALSRIMEYVFAIIPDFGLRIYQQMPG